MARSVGYHTPSTAYPESDDTQRLDEKASNGNIRSTLVSKNITILGRRTSVRLEPEMWNALRDIARREGCTAHEICSLIQIRKNTRTSLTAAIRVFLMLYYRAAATDEGHQKAGHGSFEIMKRRANVTRSLSEYQPQTPANGMSDQLQDSYMTF